LRLGFPAFGPFTGLSLDLSGGAPGGFHVIFGPNEAGKSSALRGVHHLLYGFPERTSDAHVHPSTELRITAALAAEGGKVLDIQRLKRRKDALRDGHDAPLDESALSELLAGVDARIFERLFGLDHERLKQAGEALLEDQGDVGESLFDAGSGGRGIRRVLDELGRGADEIFKPRSSKARLNVLLDGYKEARAATRDAQVSPEKWLEQRQKLDSERKRVTDLGERRKKLLEDSIALSRLDGALGPIARRGALREKLAAIGPVPALPEDASERRRSAERIRDDLSTERARLQREFNKKQERLAELVVQENLLGVSPEAIEKLRDLVGEFRKAQEDLPKRREDVRRREAEVMRLASGLYPGRALDQLDVGRPGAAELARVRTLPQKHAELNERVKGLLNALRNHELDLAETVSALAELKPSEELGLLKRAFSAARSHGDSDRRLREMHGELGRLEAKSRAQSATLGLWQGELETASHVPLPQAETIARFRGEFEQLSQRRAHAEREAALASEQLSRVVEKIGSIQRSGSVPSEAALSEARARRGQGLARVQQAWQSGAPPEMADPEFAVGQPLIKAFEQSMSAADEIADRLWREAERVSSMAALEAERHRLQSEAEASAERLRDLSKQEAEAQGAWRAAWQPAGIEPRTPAEMSAWIGLFRNLCEALEQTATARRELETLRSERAAIAESLGLALKREVAPEQALAPALAACEEAIELGTRAGQRRSELTERQKKLERQRAEVERDLSEARAALEQWQDHWSAAVKRLGFVAALSPEELAPLVDSVSDLFTRLDELGEQRRRAQRMEQDRVAFERVVAEWLETYAADLRGRAPDVAAEELVRRFQSAENQREERAQLRADVDQISSELSALEARAERVTRELDALLNAANAPDLVALAEVEQRSAEARELLRQIDALEGSLVGDGGGPTLDELVEAARGVDRAALQVRLLEVKEEIERLHEEHQDASAEVRSLEQGLDTYTDNDAAERAQFQAVQVAEIREQALRYARLRLSAVVLEREVERYREQNQGPVLKRASALFPLLTLGYYRGLRVGVEERQIVALRENGKEVPVAGLSEGARYQLYLALRVATLERYLERNPPLPMILDDILIHFDDERAAAALSVLGGLADRIQILFFTHHARDLALAERAIPASRLFRHDLAAPGPSATASAAVGATSLAK